MKSTLMIKDLSVNKELDRKALCAVRGGSNFAIVGGNSQAVLGGGIFSPVTAVQVGPTVTQVNASVDLNLATINNVLGYQAAAAFQA